MPSIAQFRASPDFITIANRKRGEWLRVDNQDHLQPVTTWLGKQVFWAKNYFLKNKEMERLAAVLENNCQQLEEAISSLTLVKKGFHDQVEFNIIAEQVSEFSLAHLVIQTMQNNLNGMKENIITPTRLQTLVSKLEKQLAPFLKQFTSHVYSRRDDQFDFTLNDPNHNGTHSKQLLQYQKMIERLKIVGKEELLQPLAQAISTKVEYAKRKIMEKQTDISATIDKYTPFHTHPDKVNKGIREIRDLKDRLKHVDTHFYNMASLVRLEKAFREPELTEALRAIEEGQTPKLLVEGINGTYMMPDRQGMPCGIFKPAEQETGTVGNPKGYFKTSTMGVFGIRAGTGYLRERVAYLLDKGHKANIPYTTIAAFSHHAFNQELTSSKSLKGSFQVFARGCNHLVDTIPKSFRNTVLTGSSFKSYFKSFFMDMSAKIPTEQIHALAVFDIRVLNGDRHLKNALVDSSLKLYSIDHGLILPTQAKSLKFEWMQLPQAKLPFSNEMLEYIEDLNEETDAAILRDHKIEKDAIDRMRIAYKLLKIGAQSGLTAYEIGDLMKGKKAISHFESVICNQIIVYKQPAEKVLKQNVISYIKARQT